MRRAETRIAPGQIYQDVYAKRDEGVPAVCNAQLEVATLEGGALHFADVVSFDRALDDGIFRLKIPDGLDLGPCDAFAEQFYLEAGDAPFGGFRDYSAKLFGDPLLGFHRRANQIEQFLLERRFWDAFYPQEIAAIGHRLTDIAWTILASVVAKVGIPRAAWRQATGGCSDQVGSYHLTFNHYRPEVNNPGLASHKDDGFVTILRAKAPGLEVNRRSVWERVPGDDRTFVVNFGLAMELLTAYSARPVAAVLHRVRRLHESRSSFGHFTSSQCGQRSDQGIYRYLAGHGLERICSSRELIDTNDSEIYAGTLPPVDSAPR